MGGFTVEDIGSRRSAHHGDDLGGRSRQEALVGPSTSVLARSGASRHRKEQYVERSPYELAWLYAIEKAGKLAADGGGG